MWLFHKPTLATFAALTAVTLPACAQVNFGGKGYVDLGVYGGTPDGKGAGILYGMPNDPAYSPQTAPARSTWGSLFQGAGVSWVRAGGAQIPFGGYAADIANGGTTGYDNRFASARRNYQDMRALNPNAKFVLLPHDIWGADSVTTSTKVYPCDNNNCDQYGKFLDKLIADLKNKCVFAILGERLASPDSAP